MTTQGAKMAITILLLFALLFVTALSGSITPNTINHDDLIEQWWDLYSGGGLFVFKSEGQIFEIPVSTSSQFKANETRQIPVHAIEDTEQLNGTTSNIEVLRGKTEDASIAIILKANQVAAIVNTPHGSNRIVIPPNDTPSPPPLTEARTEKSDEYVGDGSIRHSKYQWTTGSSPAPENPVNVIFYDDAHTFNVHIVLGTSGWEQTACGGNRQVWLEDEPHGGSNAWWQEDDQYQDDGVCWQARYHIRTFPSSTGDTHTPGFESYLVVDVHWENTFHTQVYPQDGQDYLLSQLSTHPDIDNVWLKQVGGQDSECEWCHRWDGWVDLYQIYKTSGQDPCSSSGPNFQELGTNVKTIRWTCS